MRISRDIVFDETHHFYPRPSFDASSTSLVDPLPSLFFQDAYAPTIPTSCLEQHLTESFPTTVVPSSVVPPLVSSSESPWFLTTLGSLTHVYARRVIDSFGTTSSSDELPSSVVPS